ncbi:MAG: phage holin family protein [Opitutales bacterium]|nr:phage holin family protein [Opitutales bacterium]
MNTEENGYKVKITRRVNLGFWKGCGIIAIALLISKLTTGNLIDFQNAFSFFGLVLLIWILNLMLKPILIVFTLPFVLFTLGAGIILLEAFIIWLAAEFVPGIALSSFWIALWAGFLIEAISWVFAIVESPRVEK